MTKQKTSSAIRLYVICAIFSALSMPLLDAQTPADSVVIRQVDSLIQVVRNYSGKQDFDQALGTLAIAEAIALEKLGRESAAYGACCSNHGRIRSIQRQYDDALQWAFQAAEIQEKTIGKMHPDRGRTLQTIAASCANSYQYERGLPYGLEAKDIFEHTLGKADINYGRAISVIAICYAQLGRFEDAEPLFLEGRDLAQAKGKDTEECAIIIGNLSHFYLLMGNFQKSLQFSLEATELKRKLYGEDAPEYAFGLQNLASSYGKLLDFKKAESLYLQALSIYEKKYGKEDQDYVEILQFLATMYSIMSDHQKSVPLFLEVLAIKEKILGKENWGYGIAANNLAVEYIETGEWEKARLLLTEYVEINKKSGGTDQPEYAESLNNLAIAYVNLGLYEKSEALYGEISARLQAAMSRSLHHLSERETQEYLKKYSYFQDCALSLAQVKYRKNGYTTPLSGTCYDNALYFKGFLLNAAARARNTAAADPANTDRLNLLKSVERKLGDAYVTPLAERDSAAVADLEAQANDLEKNLARNIAGYTDATRSVKWQDVQKQLQAGDAAIEFVRFDFYDKSVMHASDSVFYAALIIRPESDQPRFITLFEEREIDALFKNKGARKSDYVNTLYASPARSAGGQKNLYQAIWQPLESALADTKTVYFSPAGLLHRINFNAITDKDGKPLGDRLNFVQLGSTRQLALPQPTANAALSLEARLFGGINYESDTLNNPPVEVKSPAPSDYAGTRGNFRFEDADSTLRGGAWGYLPWTDKEVSNVARILNQSGYQPILYNGSKGSEEAFKSIGATGASPRVLHLATHGYFFPDPQRLPQQAGANESAFKSATHPMIRSGLILAGGNYAWKTGKPFRPEGEDGVITAYEISQMNLSNTELVVLSACETGLGDIEGNEGVYGLQRAFKIAGVRYIVMSLWQVPDAQTQELMTAFYTNWLTRKMVIPEAFSAAQKTMQEKYEHPFFWAGFVLLR